MSNEILLEIKKLRNAITQVLGVDELPVKEQFSKKALDKVAKEFKKLQIERNNWVKEYDISKYLKNAGYGAGAFLRQELEFTNYFKRGKSYFYCKQDLIALARELKQRNVNLGRYIEFVQDKAKFEKYLADAKQNKRVKGKGKAYILSDMVKDVETSAPPMPDPDTIRKDIARLKEEFFQFNLSEYIDIYGGNHAMTKFVFHFDKYLEPGLRKKSKKWCEEFNYANRAFELVTGQKETFIPVKEEDRIQL